MEFVAGVVGWLLDPAHWAGTDGVPNRVGEHLWVSALAVLLATALAGPAGVWLGHHGRGELLAVNVTNLGRALPSMALLAFALPLSIALGLGLGFWPTLISLVPLGVPPILTNAYTAVRGVDRDVVEAARGMGLSERQILGSIELPLAFPLILAGVRNAAVAIIATATLGALVAGGGLGRYIVDGLALQDYGRLGAGALLVALLAILAEVAFGLLERAVGRSDVRADRTRAPGNAATAA